MSKLVEIFLLLEFLVFMVMLWRLKKCIQTTTEAMASVLASQCLAIERKVTEEAQAMASVLDSQCLAIERKVTEEAQATASVLDSQCLAIERKVTEEAQAMASVLASQCLAIERKVTDVLEELVYMSISDKGRERPKRHDVQLRVECQGKRPIFVATAFKSGTKLLEHIIAKLTGLGINAPTMSAGSDYESADPIVFENGKFFIWHNVPSDSVKARLIVANAQPIFLVRNIYDLVVSQYFHFACDVDAGIGHATHTEDYFRVMGQDEGISLLLSGASSEFFHWHGFSYYLHQIQEMLQFSKEYPCHIIVYDRLVQDKRREIERLAAVLAVEPSEELYTEIIDSSRLDSMRESRMLLDGNGKHFRKGIPGDHINVLKRWHYHMINQIKLTAAPRLDSLCEELGFYDVIGGLLQGEGDSGIRTVAK